MWVGGGGWVGFPAQGKDCENGGWMEAMGALRLHRGVLAINHSYIPQPDHSLYLLCNEKYVGGQGKGVFQYLIRFAFI